MLDPTDNNRFLKIRLFVFMLGCLVYMAFRYAFVK